MSPGLEALDRFVSGAGFLAKKAEIAGTDFDVLLEEIESGPFEENWRRTYDRVEALRGDLPEEDRKRIEDIGKRGYLRTYELTESADLAGCVCDDLELIASALALGVEDSWLNGLWLRYRSGGLPQGQFESVSGRLNDLL